MITMSGHDRIFDVPQSLRQVAGGCDLSNPVIRRLTLGRVTAWDMLNPVVSEVPGADRWSSKMINSMIAAHGVAGSEACGDCTDTGFYGQSDIRDEDTLVRLFRRVGDDGYQVLTADGSWQDWTFCPDDPVTLEVLSLELAQDLADAVLTGATGLTRRFYWPVAFLPPGAMLAATPGLPDQPAAPDLETSDWSAFAIVDDLDTGAVLQIVRIKPGPELERYDKGGQWTPDPALLSQLQGVKPPPLIELDDAKLKDVLDQVDQGTATAASGLVADAPLTVSPDPRAEKLRRYWSTGEGAAKIRWGTPGSWTRCYRHLRKYMGVRAKGYCANLTRRVEGKWPGAKHRPGHVGSLTTSVVSISDSPSAHVLGMGHRFKMIGPKAIGYTAEVVKLQTVFDLVDPELITDAMNELVAAIDTDDRVALLIERCNPDPTTVVDDQAEIEQPVFEGPVRVSERPITMITTPSVVEVGRTQSTLPDRLRAVVLAAFRNDADLAHRAATERVAILLPASVVRLAQTTGNDRTTRAVRYRAGHSLHSSPEESLVAAIQAQTWSGENGRTVTMAGIKDGIYEETVEDQFQAIVRGLTAGAFPVKPPDEWFENPRLASLTPLTVEDSGQVYGHLASFEMPHIGLPGKVRAPKSHSGYAYFMTGAIPTASGKRARVGQLTLAGGHAPLNADAGSAVAHYDNTDSAIADVAVGEDRYGIWFAGALRPEASPEKVRAFMASALSGDWRPINGHLEMVACCSVNVPGFPIARAMAAGGALISLVAAGARQIAVLSASMRADAAVVERLAALETAVYAEPTVEEVIETGTTTEPVDISDNGGDDKVARARALVAERKEKRRQELRDRVHGVAAGGVDPKVMAAAAPHPPHERPGLGGYPVAHNEQQGVADLKKAIKAYGRAKESERAATRRHIIAQARRLHHPELIPKDWAKTASGALTAAPLNKLRRAFQEWQHPRGKDGQFIEKGGIVNVDTSTGVRRGKITDLTEKGPEVQFQDGKKEKTLIPLDEVSDKITAAPESHARLGPADNKVNLPKEPYKGAPIGETVEPLKKGDKVGQFEITDQLMDKANGQVMGYVVKNGPVQQPVYRSNVDPALADISNRIPDATPAGLEGNVKGVLENNSGLDPQNTELLYDRAHDGRVYKRENGKLFRADSWGGFQPVPSLEEASKVEMQSFGGKSFQSTPGLDNYPFDFNLRPVPPELLSKKAKTASGVGGADPKG